MPTKNGLGIWLVVAGCIAFIAVVLIFPALKDSGAISDAKSAAARGLKDPSSAQFRDVRRTRLAVCGEVNAKNGYGAYTGFKRFYVADGTVTREPTETGLVIPGLPTDAETFDLGWRINCGPQA